jgi:Asp-tRNA(Asn)/Glu-tRNA(Gln) amidotransferase B subunit
MSDYKIKLEDKAAFLNRLEKQGIAVDSFDIKDNKLKGYFEFTVDDPQANEIIKTILKQSPKINKLKEMKQSLTREQLRQIIREELDAAGVEKVNEISLADPMVWGPALALLSTLGLISGAVVRDIKGAKTPEEKKQKLKSALSGIEKATGGQ